MEATSSNGPRKPPSGVTKNIPRRAATIPPFEMEWLTKNQTVIIGIGSFGFWKGVEHEYCSYSGWWNRDPRWS